ncbi:hypothetical protein Ga0466249_001707 [Sporomusaceae bacterium BoRhaA]|uniref:hypothetical protein n=1 Tax=Pelorhabdus rhamnosifermentans TaxID=2772457 RepID=UPI001FE99C0C|nr:hypothetical protein [Pelorhabdus rhamnosifermentans]MBU2700615.1 hypothetical protein [Pelorhabdus rhamnosifermentans]
MATIRIVQRSKKSFTLIIDHGIDGSGKRKKETRTIKTTDISVAERERDILIGQLADRSYRPLAKTTVEEYITHWLTTPAFTNLASKTQNAVQL